MFDTGTAFSSTKPTTEQAGAMNELREAYTKLAILIRTRTPIGQRQNHALTLLESSSMWANKAITHGGE